MILGPNGENVFPEDLEAELNKHPDVRDSAVIGLEHDGRVVIHVVLLMDKGNADEIIEHTNQHLASHQKIISWTAWPEADFPRSATRKVKKQDLIKTISSKSVNKTKITGTITPLSRLIAQTTNHDPASVQNSTQLVAELELDSLLRIELVGRIEEEFGVELAENQITPKTTVAELQALIEQHQGHHQYIVSGEYPRWSHSRFCNRLRPLLQSAIFSLIPILGKIRIKGMENLQGEVGPVILMTNHLSYLDGLPTIYAITRHFKSNLAVAASLETLYEQLWWMAPFVDLSMNSYPFSTRLTENIKPSLEYTGRLLDEKCNVLIFPEGGINRSENPLRPLKGGTGILAVEMQVPVVPMVIVGTNKILPPGQLIPRKRGDIEVRFGKPIRFALNENYVDATRTIEEALLNLLQNKQST